MCDPAGTAWFESPCGPSSRCVEAGGGASCQAMACTPNEGSCHPTDPSRRLVCAADGSAIVEVACASGSTCHEPSATCLDACARAAAEGRGAGCEYWFTHLPNGAGLRLPTAALTLVVGNPGPDPAAITVDAADGVRLLEGAPLAAGQMMELPLPWQAFSGTGDSRGAFRLGSTAPVVAHTVSRVAGEDRNRCIARGCYEPPCWPDDSCAVYTTSGDGTLLLPWHLLTQASGAGSGYLAFTPRHQQEIRANPGLLSLVGTRDGTTATVEFTAFTEVSGAAGSTAYAPGDVGIFGLEAFDVLQFATAATGTRTGLSVGGVERAEWANDFAGTRIGSDAPLAVFAGTDVARLPLESSATDHLEEQLPPRGLWGRRYIGMPRGPGDRFDLVIGAGPALVTSTVPLALEDGSSGQVFSSLPARSVLRFSAAAPFEIRSDETVLLLQLTAGEDGVEPAFLSVPPVERHRTRYLVHVGPGSTSELHLVAPRLDPGGAVFDVRIGSAVVSGWEPLPGTDLRTARVRLCAGSGSPCAVEGFYTVQAAERFGLVVHEGGGVGIAYGGGLGDAPGIYRPPTY